MPILGLQVKLQERGRIRIGKQVETKGKKYPKSLSSFRLTSRDRSAIESAAKAFGGTVAEWDNNGRQEFEVETEANALPVLIPPTAVGFSQWNELWAAGGCLRRCDGKRDTISEGTCVCEEEGDMKCDPHTRLSVMLPDVPGFGLWRLDTQGTNAAMEMAGAIKTLQLLSVNGQIVPGTLRLDQRSIKHPNEGIKRFVVPMIDFDVTPLLTAAASGTQPPLTPVPQKAAPPNIEQQMKAVENIESSRKRAADIKPTGISPRTAAEAVGGKPAEKTVVKVTGEFHADNTQLTSEPPAGEAQDSEQTGLFDEPPPPPEPGPFTPINARQLGIIGHLFNAIKMPAGDEIRLNWCSDVLQRTLGSPGEMTETDAIVLIAKLSNLQRIRAYYTTDNFKVILTDLTEYLQLEKKLGHLADLSDDDIASVIEAIEMTETTGHRVLGLQLQEGAPDEATPQTEKR